MMTASIVCAMTDQGRLDRALTLVLAAQAVIHSAIVNEHTEGLDLSSVAVHVRRCGNFFMAAGALPEEFETVEEGLTVEEAAAVADGYLRRAAQECPSGSQVEELEFEGLVELWGAIRGLLGWR